MSYAAQRLWDARTEPPLGTVVAQAVIPYFWRLGITALHALAVGSLLYFGLSEAGARRLVAATPWLAPLLALPAMLAMMAVP